MLEELDKYECKVQHRTYEYISTLTTALKMLDSEQRMLEDVKKDGRKEFICN